MSPVEYYYDGSDIAFETLPPALRRKYFSSLERLRLAQDSTSPSFKSCQRAPSRNSLRARTHSKNFSNDLDRRLSLIKSIPRNRLQKRRSVNRNSSFTPVTSTWFASLPPAVRRKHFSRDEQILYSPQRQSVILDAADESFYKHSQRRSRLTTSTSFPDLRYDRDAYLRDSTVATWEDNSSIDMADYSLDGLSWLEDGEELDLRLDDYHSAITETAQRQTAAQTKSSFRRRVSLSNISIRRYSASSSQTASQFSPSATSTFQVKSNPSFSGSFRQHNTRPSSSSIDPGAAHYQDPAARMKLRVYLASPQKFDEAVEFGFPALQEVSRLRPERPMTSPRLTHDSGRTFFSAGTPSLSGDEDDDKDEVELNDPRTPEDPVFHGHRSPHLMQTDRSGVFRIQPARIITESYPQAATADREMTLHMTLTRPDLRSPDDVLTSEPLPTPKLPLESRGSSVTETPLTIWDTLPLEEESKVKKLWRKLKLK